MAGKRYRLVSTRRAAGFSQERWTEVVGVDRSTVMRWERGETRRLCMLDDCLALHQAADVADLRHDIQIACTAS